MAPRIFQAKSLKIGRCDRPACAAVHVELLDKHGDMRAQALVPLETVDALVRELILWRDGKTGIGHPISSNLH